MKLKLDTYKYVRQLVEGEEVELPDEPCYFFETGIRRAIRIIPVWTSWMKREYDAEEYIYKYHITCVYRSFENKIESYCIDASPQKIAELYNSDRERSNVICALLKDWLHPRTKADFDHDLSEAIKSLSNYE